MTVYVGMKRTLLRKTSGSPGSGSGGSSYTPTLNFSDARNSQYAAIA